MLDAEHGGRVRRDTTVRHVRTICLAKKSSQHELRRLEHAVKIAGALRRCSLRSLCMHAGARTAKATCGNLPPDTHSHTIYDLMRADVSVTKNAGTSANTKNANAIAHFLLSLCRKLTDCSNFYRVSWRNEQPSSRLAQSSDEELFVFSFCLVFPLIPA